VGTSQTHLVVRKDVLWELDPDQTYYEGEPGPECPYRFEWDGNDGRLQMLKPNRPSQCALARLSQHRLRLRCGSVAGHFPDSFGDELGSLEVYERVTDPAALKKLLTPPPHVPRLTRMHRRLGELRYDLDLGWWEGRVSFGGVKGVSFHLEADRECPEAILDRAAKTLAAVRCADLKAYAAKKLLRLKNDDWLGDDEKPFTARSFQARLSPESVGMSEEGTVTVYFNDGDLFWGHVVVVELNSALKPVDADIAG